MRPASAALAMIAAALAPPEAASQAQAQAGGVGIANPASEHCLRQGGRLEIREGRQGQFGVCILADGRPCEEWALFRGGRCVRPPE